VDEADKPAKEKCEAYPKFWREYGKALKMGVIEDSTNRNRIAKLLRFTTSKSGDKTVSLDQYIARMKEGQKEIYFLTGSSVAELRSLPSLSVC
jgi:heat shock protein beta